MKRAAAIAAAFFSLAGLGALAARRLLRGSSGDGDGAAETLTPIRVQALAAVAGVVPSAYPDAQFRALAPSFNRSCR